MLDPEEGTGGVFSPMVTRVQLWGGSRQEWLCPPRAWQGCDLVPGTVWSSIRPWDRGQAPVRASTGAGGCTEGFGEEKH